MRSLVFATNNTNKLEEIRAAIGPQLQVIGLKEAGIDIDIPEPHDTLEENATEKSRTINNMTGLDCFSEDTGLEVDFLGGEPGVHSARYAGDERSFEKNTAKLLAKLGESANRSARFRTVISLIWKDQEYLFEGICEGTIDFEPRGEKGFGYDPVFMPSGTNRTFAEMDLAEKNEYSHRRKAADLLVAFLKNQGD